MFLLSPSGSDTSMSFSRVNRIDRLVIKYEFSKFCTESRKKLNTFRIDKKYCDVIVKVEEETFHCHRAILASSSHYFDMMLGGNFKENSVQDIVLHDIDAASFKVLLEFMYTGCVEDIDDINKHELLLASSILNISAIEYYCASLISRMLDEYQLKELIELFVLACSIHNKNLMTGIIDVLLDKHFNEISLHDEFYEISVYGLNLLFERSSEKLVEKFRDEDIALDILIRWVHRMPHERKKYFEKLSEGIRFELVSTEYVKFLLREYDVAGSTLGIIEDKLQLSRKNIVDFFEFKSNTSPISIGDPSLVRNQVGLCVYITYEDAPSLMHLYRSDKNEHSWYPSGERMTINDGIDEDVGNIVFNNRRMYSLVGQKFLMSTSPNWSSGSRSLSYPPCKLKSFDMCGVENDNFIYLYNADIYTYPTMTRMNSSSYPASAFSVDEIRRGVFGYNCELDRWLALPKMKLKLTESFIIADKNLLYVIGGNRLEGVFPGGHVQAYDKRMKNWLKLSNTSLYYYHHRACCASILNGKVYISNGNVIEAFDTVAGKWETLRSFTPCHDHLYQLKGRVSRMVSYKNCLWLISSQPENNIICTNIIYPHNESPEKWQKNFSLGRTVGRIVDVHGRDHFAARTQMKNLVVFAHN